MLRRLAVPVLALVACGALAAELPEGPEFVNSIGMRFVRIEPGSFRMGRESALPPELLDVTEIGNDRKIWLPEAGDHDERPAHRVTVSRPFYLAVTEVTNEQYERYDRLHALVRGRDGFSIDDDEAVVFVSWHEAKAFCDWLSEREGRPYRLPTEAEWEYAARAGTPESQPFWSGDAPPEGALRNATNSWYPEPTRGRGREEVLPLHVGRTPASPWGLLDVHGNVEEWVADWYGPYEAGDQQDPVGRATGDFRVTRGGSHSTVAFYLRSGNRMGTLPEERTHLIGFRVALGEPPGTDPLPKPPPALHARDVADGSAPGQAPDPQVPFFSDPRPYVHVPEGSFGPLFSRHNHAPALAECPNGDLLAAWFTTQTERGREMGVAASRLRRGHDTWDDAAPFWDPPDRNDGALALWYDGDRTLYHFNSVSVAATWGPMAVVMRTSTDSGATWSPGRMIVPEHHWRRQVVPSVFRTREGHLVLPADATPTGHGGSALHVSRDGGETWVDPGGTIAGIHTAVAQIEDGSLLAFGRGDAVEGHMPRSRSRDMGRRWEIDASPFPTIGGGQRPVLRRLREGPLLFVSFARETEPVAVELTDASGRRRRVHGLFAALSYDGGETWPRIRVVGDDPETPQTRQTMNGEPFELSRSRGEPRGYLTAIQARDGLIHLISSWNHYTFNLKWLETPPPPE